MERLRNLVSSATSGAAFGFAFFGAEELLFAILRQPALMAAQLLALLPYYLGLSALIGAILGAFGLRSLTAALWLWAGFTGVLLWGAFGPLAMGLGLPWFLGAILGSLLTFAATIGLLFVTREQERKRWGACAGAWLSAVLIAVINGHQGDPLRPTTLGLDLAALLFAVAIAGMVSSLLEDRRPRPGGIAFVVGVVCWVVWLPVNQLRGVAMPDPKPDSEHPPVLIVDISGLRSDALGFFTPGESPTPNLDALAARSIVYRYAQAAAPWAGAGYASLVTGQLPSVHGVTGRAPSGNQAELRSDVRTLAEYMHGAGYATRAIATSRYVIPGLGFEQGFEAYHFVSSVGHMPALLRALAPLGLPLLEIPPHASAELAAFHARRFIRSQGEGPWFLVLQLSDLYPHRGAKSLSAAEYRASLAEIDRALEPVLDVIHPSAWIFVVSDHGMNLGEHAATAPAHPSDAPYGFNLYQEHLETPLVVFRPRNLKPLVITQRVSTCDVLPTVLDLAQLEPLSSLHGRQLTEALGSDVPTPGDRSLVSQAPLYGPPLQAVVRGEWKYVESADSVELYNLAIDPKETENLAETAQGQPIAEELGYELPGRARPVQAPTLDPDFLGRYENELPTPGTPTP